MFSSAIVRPPGENFASGLTTAGLGQPDYDLALEQHEEYCRALEHCGLILTALEADVRHPDSTFVEDTAVITKRGAILARPGATSRLGEVTEIRDVLLRSHPALDAIVFPGTLDGGDVCEAGDRFFIGISARTNEEGAEQLSGILKRHGYATSVIDVRTMPGILHLKSGLAFLGDNRLVAVNALADQTVFRGYNVVRVTPGEEYAANCIRVNSYVLFPKGFPSLERDLRKLGCRLVLLDMSEFQKMDGGLSCLSLRF